MFVIFLFEFQLNLAADARPELPCYQQCLHDSRTTHCTTHCTAPVLSTDGFKNNLIKAEESGLLELAQKIIKVLPENNPRTNNEHTDIKMGKLFEPELFPIRVQAALKRRSRPPQARLCRVNQGSCFVNKCFCLVESDRQARSNSGFVIATLQSESLSLLRK